MAERRRGAGTGASGGASGSRSRQGGDRARGRHPRGGAAPPAGAHLGIDRAATAVAPPPARVNTLLRAGAAVQRSFERRGWQFCFIGGVANFRWGTPRLTDDLDLTLLTGFGNEAGYVDALLAEFTSRVQDPAEFAARNRVVLLRTPDGYGLDVALGAMPFEERSIARASSADLASGVSLRTCSAEALLAHHASPA